jgi:hypothetical protein
MQVAGRRDSQAAGRDHHASTTRIGVDPQHRDVRFDR